MGPIGGNMWGPWKERMGIHRGTYGIHRGMYGVHRGAYGSIWGSIGEHMGAIGGVYMVHRKHGDPWGNIRGP